MRTGLSIVFVFGLMIMIHELGHFLMAKKAGIKVLEFSFGFGPKLLGYQGRETLYAWRLVPLGGFVRMYGMDAEVDEHGVERIAPADDKHSFMNKTVWQRMAVIAAGPVMNFVLAAVLFVIMGIPTMSPDSTVGSLLKGKPAEKAGIMAGDRIMAIDNVPIADWTALTEAIHAKPEQAVTIKLQRGGQQQTVQITTEKDPQTNFGIIGIYPTVVYKHLPVGETLKFGLTQTLSFTRSIVVALAQMITRQIPADLGGPVAIGNAIGEAAQQGWHETLGLTGMLSIQLGLLNLFPIPALDGSRLVFLLVEGIRRKPLNPEKENLVHLVGFVLLLALMLAVTYHDIVSLFVKAG